MSTTTNELVELTPAQRALVERARSLAEERLGPSAARWDEEETFPEPSFQALKESGLLGLTVPRAYGGDGLGVFEACLVLEELARACTSSALIAQMFLNGPPRAIARLGTEEQRRRLLPSVATGESYWAVAMTEPDAGSAGTDLSTSLTDDGGDFRLTGTKWAITGGTRADHFLVFCRQAGTEGPRGIGAVVVPRGAEGFEEPEAEAKMGLRGVAEATLTFEDVRVPVDDVVIRPEADSTAGARLLVRQFNPERCGNAAMCIGIARAALDAAVEFAKERHQFGRPIAEFQGIQWKLANMALEIEAARLLTWQAALSDEDGFPRVRDTAMAKLYAGEMAQRVTNEAIQIHGHRGYTRARAVERHFRDVRGLSLGGGTAEMLRNVLASEVTGLRFSQRRPDVRDA